MVHLWLGLTFNFNQGLVSEMYHYMKHIVVHNIMIERKTLVKPIIVGWLFGPVGVGIISFSEKVIHAFKFYKNNLHRVSTAVLSRLNDNRKQLVMFLKNSLLLYILPLGISNYLRGQLWLWLIYLCPSWSHRVWA